jgi:hypothetical protein
LGTHRTEASTHNQIEESHEEEFNKINVESIFNGLPEIDRDTTLKITKEFEIIDTLEIKEQMSKDALEKS